MTINHDDSMLFTAGIDGTLIFYKLKDNKIQTQEKDESLNIYMAEDFLIKNSDYKAKLKKLANLEK